MARSRVELQNLLESIAGSENVYFQPPQTIKLNYPCIIFKRSDIPIIFANNKVFHYSVEYQITVVSRSPIDPINERLIEVLNPRFDRNFVSDGLNHDVYRVVY